jgi:hypothetical protein
MKALPSLFSAAGICATSAMLAAPSSANAADVYVYGARPVAVVPAPRVYVAPASTVTVTPSCATRSVRVWTGDRYVYRTVRVCA